MAIAVAGQAGALRVGYQRAALLGAWRLSLAPKLPRAYTLDADLVELDTYWATQRPLTLVLELPGVSWEWFGVEPSVVDGRLRADIGGAPTVVRWAQSREG